MSTNNNFDIIDYHLSHGNYTHEELFGIPDGPPEEEILDSDSVFSKYYNNLCNYQKSVLFPDIYESNKNDKTDKNNKNTEKDKNCKCEECERDFINEYANNYESDTEIYEEYYYY